MTKQFALDGLADNVEFGKDGNRLDMSNGHASITNNQGDLIEVRGANATHSSGLVTKSQLDSATGQDGGTVWLNYSTQPELEGFTQRQTKEFDLTTGTASLLDNYSTVPSNMSWDEVDERTYIIDTTNGLITPNDVDKQPVSITTHIMYSQKGGVSNSDMGGIVYLVEYDGSQERMAMEEIFIMPDVDNREGVITVTFHTNVTNHVNGTGKGWRLKIRSNESDGNLNFKLKTIRMRCG